MRYEYNEKISEKANRSLARRQKTVARRKRMLFTFCALMAAGLLVFGGSHIFASAENTEPLNAYYTSVSVESGDTLWTLADQYMTGSELSKKAYIEKIRSINQLSKDQAIHPGQNLIFIYYSEEEK